MACDYSPVALPPPVCCVSFTACCVMCFSPLCKLFCTYGIPLTETHHTVMKCLYQCFCELYLSPSYQSSLKLRALLVLELVPVIGSHVSFTPLSHLLHCPVLLHPSASHPWQIAAKTHLSVLSIVHSFCIALWVIVKYNHRLQIVEMVRLVTEKEKL